MGRDIIKVRDWIPSIYVNTRQGLKSSSIPTCRRQSQRSSGGSWPAKLMMSERAWFLRDLASKCKVKSNQEDTQCNPLTSICTHIYLCICICTHMGTIAQANANIHTIKHVHNHLIVLSWRLVSKEPLDIL